MRCGRAGVALLIAVGLAACGSGSATVRNASDSGGAPVTTTVTRTATDASAATPTGSSGASTTPTASQSGSGGSGLTGTAGDVCAAGHLAVSFLGGQGATGHGLLGFALRNTGTASCSTVGYPGIEFLARDGSPLPTTPTHATDDFFGHTGLHTVTVAPGQQASFRLDVSHDGASCATAYGLQVIAPNDTATMRVSLPDGASECGSAIVSPMQPGASAYP